MRVYVGISGRQDSRCGPSDRDCQCGMPQCCRRPGCPPAGRAGEAADHRRRTVTVSRHIMRIDSLRMAASGDSDGPGLSPRHGDRQWTATVRARRRDRAGPPRRRRARGYHWLGHAVLSANFRVKSSWHDPIMMIMPVISLRLACIPWHDRPVTRAPGPAPGWQATDRRRCPGPPGERACGPVSQSRPGRLDSDFPSQASLSSSSLQVQAPNHRGTVRSGRSTGPGRTQSDHHRVTEQDGHRRHPACQSLLGVTPGDTVTRLPVPGGASDDHGHRRR
jgi:hypothetical protein